MNIPFSPPFIDEEIIDEVVDTLKSGWITTGPKVQQLEREVVKLSGAPNVLCVNSATSGLMVMLKWFGVKSGDEVIIPAYTYSATALAVMNVGATPVMVDVQNDFTIDVSEIEKAITRKTKVIIPVDFAGWICDYDSIYALVCKNEIVDLFKPNCQKQEILGRIMVLSDAAHSIGASSNGKNSGSLTDVSVFSFHAVKNVTTAEGGAICLNFDSNRFDNKKLYDDLRVFILNGQTKDAFTKTQIGGWKYDIISQGFKVNMPDLCAALGLAQIRKYKNCLLKDRERIFNTYNLCFSKLDWVIVPPFHDLKKKSSFHIYPLRIDGITEIQRDQIIEKIEEKGVAVNVHFIPLPLLSLFKNKGYDIDDYPVSYNCYATEISLPIYPQLDKEQIDFIAHAVKTSYEEVI